MPERRATLPALLALNANRRGNERVPPGIEAQRSASAPERPGTRPTAWVFVAERAGTDPVRSGTTADRRTS